MHSMIVLNQQGDFRVEWDPEDPVQVGKATEEFEKYRTKGYAAFSIASRARISSFDPEQKEMVLVPQLVGG